jgi:hypothetical protein
MNDLANMLIKHKLIHEQAINDPEGFDGGETKDAVNCVQTIIAERERNYRAEIERLEAERDRLRAALEKYAKCAPDCICSNPNPHDIARAALAGKDCQ